LDSEVIFPVSNLISIQVKGLEHCKTTVVVVLVELQEETKWLRHSHEVHDGVLGLWVSDHPHNTEIDDCMSCEGGGLTALLLVPSCIYRIPCFGCETHTNVHKPEEDEAKWGHMSCAFTLQYNDLYLSR